MSPKREGREALNLQVPEGTKLKLRMASAAAGMSMSAYITEYVANPQNTPPTSAGEPDPVVAQLIAAGVATITDRLDVLTEILAGANPRSERHL